MFETGRGNLLKPFFSLMICVFCLIGMKPIEAAQAGDIELPEDDIVLTVTGKIQNTNQGKDLVLDIPMLRNLENKTYVTHTPWSDTSYRFKGALLTSVLELAGANPKATIRLVALDGYEITIPAKIYGKYKPILAFLRNNVPMTIRDRGPVWLIYPRDETPDLQNSKYDSHWIWHLTRIEVQ